MEHNELMSNIEVAQRILSRRSINCIIYKKELNGYSLIIGKDEVAYGGLSFITSFLTGFVEGLQYDKGDIK